MGGPSAPQINVQIFEPTPGPNGIFSVDSAAATGDLKVAGGLMLNFSKDPLVIVNSNDADDETIVVSDQLVTDLLFSLGLFDVLEVGLGLPIYFLNTATVNTIDVEGATLGDLRVQPKFTLLDHDEFAVGMALTATITLPTGNNEAFTSTGGATFRPGIILDTKLDKVLLAFNLGAQLQEEQAFGDLELGNALSFGAGIQYELIDDFLLVGGELYGSSRFDDFFDENETPIEGLAGVKIRTGSGINVELGTGGGIVAGFGAPAFRVFGGLRYADFDNDFDDDGILNNVDVCQREPEDRDLFEDDDGCPDFDNDKDGVCDPGLKSPICIASDACPMEPEDADGFEDEDGCPDPDNDQDTIPDTADKCPNSPGIPELAGCPSKDRDGDGIQDDVDQCPDDPEDKDQFEDDNGCPDPDNDKDGICDAGMSSPICTGADQCPINPEDKDGFEDEDGCPDHDNDKDGFLDQADKCPNKAENFNGIEDDDGCPDGKGDDLAKVEADGTIVILEKVYFDVNKSTIKARSNRVLTAVANIMKQYDYIKKVEVQGHTDDQGNDAYNLDLSQRRADAVRDYLIGKGIAGSRLDARGYGETDFLIPIIDDKGQPLRGGALRKARDNNRRVQFQIVDPPPSDNSKVRTN